MRRIDGLTRDAKAVLLGQRIERIARLAARAQYASSRARTAAQKSHHNRRAENLLRAGDDTFNEMKELSTTYIRSLD